MPLEMHAIHFKQEYLKLKFARNYEDGILILVYLFELKSKHNPVLHQLMSKLGHITKADAKHLIEPFPIQNLLTPFVSDYYLYYGSIATTVPTPVPWLITRQASAISPEQV